MWHFNTNQLSNEFNPTTAASSTRCLKDHLNEHSQSQDNPNIIYNLSQWPGIYCRQPTASQTTLNKIVSRRVFEDHSFVVVVVVSGFFSFYSQKQLILINGLNLLEETFKFMWYLLFNLLFFLLWFFYFYPIATFFFIYSRLLLLAYHPLRRWSFSKPFPVIKPICSCVFHSFLPERIYYCCLS